MKTNTHNIPQQKGKKNDQVGKLKREQDLNSIICHTNFLNSIFICLKEC
jgi:hypothetical protein